jgi:SAM-dependent methyltransferase
MNIAHEFETRKPWVTKFRINDKEYGGQFDATNDIRISQFFNYFPDAHTILELGSLEGGHSFSLASRPFVTSVVALEGRAANIEKALFVQKLVDAGNVKFIEANLQTINLSNFGQFDAVFCSGLLYHLPKPWELIHECSQVSPNLFLWTQYAREKEARMVLNGYRGKWYHEGGRLDPLSGLSKKSFWLTLGSLITLLTQHGYKEITLIDNNLEHPHGACITLAASTIEKSSWRLLNPF